ncbi:MAG TPA: hypothetical protein PLD30_16640 [Candidatus Competibacteraceae bacterium]|nr:hypothetical protein [Candidatus Competibacteraceae bacterium]
MPLYPAFGKERAPIAGLSLGAFSCQVANATHGSTVSAMTFDTPRPR